mmetsp:Transcript_47629/g.113396  ORF Transcript_47629/g.113396 Transcript_47629/m.113396 type:complete len:225 (+) Transcript_47629:576-1250(+)
MAPAPSPKSTHVFLSVQSTHLESASQPTTSAFLCPPALRNCEAVMVAKRKPEHAAVRSNANALLHPSAEAIEGASPNMSSGEDVAQITKSISEGSMPDISNAPRPALIAMSRSVWSPFRTLRCSMPVREEIHSSLVSTIDSMSLLVTSVSGTPWPTPMQRAFNRPRPSFACLACVAVSVSVLLIAGPSPHRLSRGAGAAPRDTARRGLAWVESTMLPGLHATDT